MELQQDLNYVLRKFESLFSTKPSLTNLGTHKILVKPDITPVKCHPYRLPPEKQKIMREKIKALLEMGLIRPSQSPFASPFMLINQPDGSHRLVINYAKLNAQCYCQAFPISRIDDLIDRVEQAKFLTKLDITKAY